MNSSKKENAEKLSPEDQAFLAKYGRLPPTKQILSSRLKVFKFFKFQDGDRKYFDSGDYALAKVGKSNEVGSAHPSPERIPHSIPPGMKEKKPDPKSNLGSC